MSNKQIENKKVASNNEKKQCKYDKYGFFRQRDECAYFHTLEICQNYADDWICSNLGCIKRPLITCRSIFETKYGWVADANFFIKKKCLR